MRGRPIIQWVLFLGLWSCLALPIVLVTRGEQTIQPSRIAADTSVITWVTLRFSEEPAHFELRQHGKILWRKAPADGTEFEKAFPVSMDKFGIEFVLRSRLPAAGAIEITVEPDERPERSRTLWVDGEVHETLTFSWSRND